MTYRRINLSASLLSLLSAALLTTSGCSSDDDVGSGANAGDSSDASAERSTGGGGGSGGSAGSGGAGTQVDSGAGGFAGNAGGFAGNAAGASGNALDASGTGGAPPSEGGNEAAAGQAGAEEVDAAGDGNPYMLPSCIPATVTTPLISDFTYAGGPASSVSWGNYSTSFSGFTYDYPDLSTGGLLNSDVTAGDWHVSGVVNNYAGFGLGFYCKSDASMYTGISFTIRGSLGGPLPVSDAGADATADSGARDGGPRDAAADARDAARVDAGAPGRITLFIGSAPTDIADRTMATWGTCIPRLNAFDGSCVTPSVTVDLTPVGRTYRLRWADFTGGRVGAMPVGVDPAQLTRIYWTFAWAPPGPPYAADVTIDDVTFITDPVGDGAAPVDVRDGAPVDAARD
jgi:hypothetical protein